MTYTFGLTNGILTKKDYAPEEDPDPPCTDCPHSAFDHEGDGWGEDDTGSWTWFKCFDSTCDCRVKGHEILSGVRR